MILASACGAAASFVASLVLCGVVRSFALRRALVDRPNERSLHTEPVPRIGGVAVFAGAWVVVTAALAASPEPIRADAAAWMIAATPVAVLGLIDDVRPLHFSVRLGLQLAVAAAFVAYVGVPHRLPLGGGIALSLPVAAMGVGLVLFLTAVLNIYNFMDGMDGLAGSQAVSAGLALFVVFALRGQDDLALIALAVAAASAGFLAHNYPPARIFLGDAGSTFLGFTFGALAVLGCTRGEGGVPFAACPIALAPFLLDGVFTLLRRALRREPVWKAHRTHLYQRAVATGLQHRDVLVRYLAWTAAAGAAAVLTTVMSGALGLSLAVGSMVAALLATWTWVIRRERRAEASAQMPLGA